MSGASVGQAPAYRTGYVDKCDDQKGYGKELGCGGHDISGGHPIERDVIQDRRPDKQRLRQAMYNRNRLKAVSSEPVNQVQSLAKLVRQSLSVEARHSTH
jgi:hypothetical protein